MTNKYQKQLKRSMLEAQMRIDKLSNRLPKDITNLNIKKSKSAQKIQSIEEEWIIDDKLRFELSALNPINHSQPND